MQRRKFIKGAAISTVALPGIFNGFGVTAHGENSPLSELLTPGVANDHIVVIVQMSGGNDPFGPVQ
jgi:hypothetical protein